MEIENLVILCSTTPETGPWTPLLKQQVPAKIRDPEVIGRMLGGEYAKTDEDTNLWYRAVRANEIDA